ncbi:Xaa-Pro peptidase family protein [Pleionea sp. CnH1-48]|uniref:M24 family metallopeptidase n=1 Tax=Pleionea sp. CnH1-48 TaxID=2954494 RepID=UPI00209789B8|nr:Xaa-Pro peptidase family protein [Pleionea sp. CnH1-48]MCO7227070.1 Xaa-Pro peptidase family protein [Pleionea sp. CnH1-48]
MTIGVGGSTQQQALASLSNMTDKAVAITLEEHQARVAKAQAYMQAQGIDAIYLNAGTNLTYFTGTQWYASERMVGAVLPASGPLEYIAPVFEIGSLQDFMILEGAVNGWHEHESPYELFIQILQRMNKDTSKSLRVGIDESTAFFVANGIQELAFDMEIINAKEVTAHCRTRKSVNEIALMQRAKDMTLSVQKAAAAILQEGISTTEVEAFINEAHKKVGAPAGSYFCIVLFGQATAFPHGVKEPQYLKKGDVVLIDTGCKLHGYISDITRTYVFGEPNERQRQIWDYEKQAQQAAFEAAQLGIQCMQVDAAARKSLAANGLSAEYELPGLPHRTGHGIGLDIHEWPYLVGNDTTPLDVGMCFSNEPMICVPGEFGIRLEDHFYMTEQGPKWFTEPSRSIDDPFGLNVA